MYTQYQVFSVDKFFLIEKQQIKTIKTILSQDNTMHGASLKMCFFLQVYKIKLEIFLYKLVQFV